MAKAKTMDASALLIQSPREVKQLLSADRFQQLKFWGKLSDKEQQIVKDETTQLVQAMMIHGGSKLAMGEHFLKLREVLEPKRCFQKHLKAVTKMPLRTALRYITAYQNASTQLPLPVLKAVMAYNLNMLGDSEDRPLGKYTEAVEILPPPNTSDPERINKWITDVEDIRMKRSSLLDQKDATGKKKHVDMMARPTGDPNKLLRSAYRAFDSLFRRLSNHDGRVKAKFVHKLAAFMAADLGVANLKVDAEAVPAGFKAVRGRPRHDKKKAEPAAAAMQ